MDSTIEKDEKIEEILGRKKKKEEKRVADSMIDPASVSTSYFDLVAVCEIVCGVGHVFQTLVETEQVPAKLVGHLFDALITVRFALFSFRLDTGVFGALVVHKTRFAVAVAVARRRRPRPRRRP